MLEEIKKILERTGLNWENEYEDLIFNGERIIGLLNKNKHIKKEDRNRIINGITILLEMRKLT